MPFNPDAYLAKYGGGAAQPTAPLAGTSGASGSFDPDAFLAKHGGGSAVPAPGTLQQMHPDFTAADRLVVKNFANDDQSAVDYLQKRHPSLEVGIDPTTAQIRARKRDGSEASYKVLDPQTGFFGTLADPRELAMTVGGAGYDLASGAAQTAAGAVGGLAGAAAGGIGAIPGAAAASGLTGAGLELLRQKLGSALGIDQDVSGSKIALAGAGGAVAPLLFGTGASGAQIAGKALASGLGEDAVAASQRGLLGRAYDAAAPQAKNLLTKLGSLSSGASPTAIKTFAENPGLIQAMEKDPNAITSLVHTAGGDALEKSKGIRDEAIGAYHTALGGAGSVPVIDMQQVAAPLKGAIAKQSELVKAAPGNTALQDTLDALQDQYEKLFRTTKTVEESAPPVTSGLLDQFGQPVMSSGGTVKHQIPGEMEKVVPLVADKIGQKLGETAGFNTLKSGAIPGGMAQRMQGATQDEKTIAAVAGQMKEILDRQMAAVLPEDAMAARAKYGEVSNVYKELYPLLQNPRKAFSSLRNADNTPNITNLELFNKADQMFGTNLIDTAKTLQAYGTFAKPSATPLSAMGATSTSRSIPLAAAGASAGYILGNQLDPNGHGGMLGGGLGGLAGGFLGGPAALRQYIQMAARAKNLTPNALAPAAATSAWNMLEGGPK